MELNLLKPEEGEKEEEKTEEEEEGEEEDSQDNQEVDIIKLNHKLFILFVIHLF